MTNRLGSLLSTCGSSALTFQPSIYGAQLQLSSTAVDHDKKFDFSSFDLLEQLQKSPNGIFGRGIATKRLQLRKNMLG